MTLGRVSFTPSERRAVHISVGDDRSPGAEHGRPLKRHEGGVIWTIGDDFPGE